MYGKKNGAQSPALFSETCLKAGRRRIVPKYIPAPQVYTLKQHKPAEDHAFKTDNPV